MKNKKIIKIVVILISIINIIFVVSGYLITLYENSTNYYSTTHNITVLAVLILILQIANIIIVMLLKRLDVRRQKRWIILTCIIIIVTFFIPTKLIHSTEDIYSTNDGSRNSVKPLPFVIGVTDTTIYKNLYGITIINSKSTSLPRNWDRE